jgi:hypothetical protein
LKRRIIVSSGTLASAGWEQRTMAWTWSGITTIRSSVRPARTTFARRQSLTMPPNAVGRATPASMSARI